MFTATKSPSVMVPSTTPEPAIAMTETRPNEMIAPWPTLSSDRVRVERMAAVS